MKRMSVLKKQLLVLHHRLNNKEEAKKAGLTSICRLKFLINQTAAYRGKKLKTACVLCVFINRHSQPWMLLQTEEWRWVCPGDWLLDLELRPYWSVVFFLCVSLSLRLFSILSLLDPLLVCVFGGRKHSRIELLLLMHPTFLLSYICRLKFTKKSLEIKNPVGYSDLPKQKKKKKKEFYNFLQGPRSWLKFKRHFQFLLL